jgi:hypothetical protein
MEYKSEDFISFIENNRRDKVSPNGLELIAKRFRELECEVNKLSLAAVSGSLSSKCFTLANELAIAGYGNEAVMLHSISNSIQ